MNEQLENKYKVKDKELKLVTEELKKGAVATSAKLTRYEARREEYVRNRMFQINHAKLFEILERQNRMT